MLCDGGAAKAAGLACFSQSFLPPSLRDFFHWCDTQKEARPAVRAVRVRGLLPRGWAVPLLRELVRSRASVVPSQCVSRATASVRCIPLRSADERRALLC